MDAPSGLGFNAAMDFIDTVVNARIPKTALTTTGDLLIASAPNTPARLGVGSNGQILTVTGGLPAWGAALGADGWNALGATLAWSSVDGHTSVATTSVDLTGSIPLGARIKVTNNATTMYFIVTAISSTAITLYGGTDYVLANSAITNPFYSVAKVPFGFNASPSKWTEELRDITNRTQATPAASTWYNPGALSLAIPIGLWVTSYQINMSQNYDNAGLIDGRISLSTSNSAESDNDLTTFFYHDGGPATNTKSMSVPVVRAKVLALAAKTSYFLVTKTQQNTCSAIGFANPSPNFIRAICAYL